jgi:uridylate kinase
MKTVVISVGGSMINPETVNTRFLHDLKPIILRAARKHKIVIVTGGGFIARDYIHALKGKSRKAQSEVGVAATRLNALLVAEYLGKKALVPTTKEQVKRLLRKDNIVVCGGLHTGKGTTSDGSTAEIAAYLKADAMINLTNVKGLYTKDPRKHLTARFIPKICHRHFKTMMDKVKEKPGQHFILDSTATRITRDNNITVIIMKGVTNLEHYLQGKEFSGTVISSC